MLKTPASWYSPELDKLLLDKHKVQAIMRAYNAGIMAEPVILWLTKTIFPKVNSNTVAALHANRIVRGIYAHQARYNTTIRKRK